MTNATQFLARAAATPVTATNAKVAMKNFAAEFPSKLQELKVFAKSPANFIGVFSTKNAFEASFDDFLKEKGFKPAGKSKELTTFAWVKGSPEGESHVTYNSNYGILMISLFSK